MSDNIQSEITRESIRLGFARAYFASNKLLLAYAYSPFPADERISAYYLASDTSYRAACALCDSLRGKGYQAELSHEKLKPLFEANGLGARGKNSLLAMPGLGSRVVLYAINTNASPATAKEQIKPASPCPTSCRACENACPAGAIDQNGFHREKCMRNYMDKADYPDWVRMKQTTFMGCEKCMLACPLNAAIAFSSPDENVLAAFSLEKLISGDAAAARALVGRNITGNGKLTAEAVTFAIREGMSREKLEIALSSPFAVVREVTKKALDGHFDVIKNI